MKSKKDIALAILVVLIVILMWSWASNIGPSFMLKTNADVECADCPFDDLARCQSCVDIFEEAYNQRAPD